MQTFTAHIMHRYVNANVSLSIGSQHYTMFAVTQPQWVIALQTMPFISQGGRLYLPWDVEWVPGISRPNRRRWSTRPNIPGDILSLCEQVNCFPFKFKYLCKISVIGIYNFSYNLNWFPSEISSKSRCFRTPVTENIILGYYNGVKKFTKSISKLIKSCRTSLSQTLQKLLPIPGFNIPSTIVVLLVGRAANRLLIPALTAKPSVISWRVVSVRVRGLSDRPIIH